MATFLGPNVTSANRRYTAKRLMKTMNEAHIDWKFWLGIGKWKQGSKRII
jgi:hypothetical protein